MGSFATGQIFGYWPSWKDDTNLPTAIEREIFNGYSKSELYVAPYYATLREEVFCSGH